jgi:Ras-related protein Rab-1A
MNNNFLFRILLIGDSGVGKSSILNRFSDDVFNANYSTTIGVDFRSKNIKIDHQHISIEMWDSTGHKRFRDITRSFYRKTNCVIVIFDLSFRQSFQNIKIWFEEIEKMAPKDSIKILVGNKLDLDREISVEEINDYVRKTNIKYIETSAKDNTNIQELINVTVEELLNNKLDGTISLTEKKSLCNKCF